MTTVAEIIKDAYRESNMIGLAAEPTEPQVVEALARLNSVVSATYGYEIGDPLIDWPVGQEGVNTEEHAFYWTRDLWAYPPINMRLVAASLEPQTIYLPPAPSDGSRIGIVDPAGRLAAAPITLDGNGRTIAGVKQLVLNVDNTYSIWMYRGDKGSWVLMSILTDTAEEFPFPPEFDDYFITALAMRLNPRYGRQMMEASVVTMSRVLDKMRARFQQNTIVAGPIGAMALTSGYGNNHYDSEHGDVGHNRGWRGSRNIRPPHYEG